MFISQNEKRYINLQIRTLYESLAHEQKHAYELSVRLDALEKSLEKKPKVRKPLTEEQKIRGREYSKMYYAKKRAEKAAKLLQVIA
jgi:transcription initiation factor IIF auxiliary subunit